jgi:predicted TIM-barrel fold metal-dependent hydrolase
MKVDIAAHILPEKYKTELYKVMGSEFRQAEGTPTITDLESRFRIMDKYPDLVQVLTVCGPPLDGVVNSKEAARLAKIANDELAELILKYPDRFVGGVATLSTNNMEAALGELDRAINDLKLRGILIWTPQFKFDPENKGFPKSGGPLDSPELDPLYDRMSRYNLPIWIHPATDAIPHYIGEKRGKYYAWQVFSWPYETTMAMNRLVFGGVLEKYPHLKFVTHHCGGMVPYFERRIKLSHDFAEMRLNRKHKRGLSQDPIEYFRMFYNDTAISGSTPGLMCAFEFFGADHLLFGTDMPFDSQIGEVSVTETIRSIEEMDIPEGEKKMIFEDNAKRLLRLPV